MLFIEDVSERPHAIERMMYNLKLGGVLEKLSGYRHRIPSGQSALHDDRGSGRRSGQGAPSGGLLSLSLIHI